VGFRLVLEPYYGTYAWLPEMDILEPVWLPFFSPGYVVYAPVIRSMAIR